MYGHNHNDANYVLQRVSLLLMFIVFTTSEIRQNSYHYALFLFLFINLISATVSILVNNEIINPLHNYISLVSDSNAISAFLMYNYHNVLLAFSSLLSFVLFYHSKSPFSFIYLLIIIIYSLSIFFEAGRAGQLLFNLFFFVSAIYFIKKKILYSILIFLFLSGINIFSYNSSGIFKHRVDKLNTIVNNEGKARKSTKNEGVKIVKDIRYIFYEEGFALAIKRPIFGYGTGSFKTVFLNNIKSIKSFTYPNFDHHTPHNNYLYIFFELGLVGLLIFLSIFYFKIRDIIRKKSAKIFVIILPLFYLFLMIIDSYFFIFTITVMYMFMYKVLSEIDLKFKKRLLQ